jgi:hypothetical protein
MNYLEMYAELLAKKAEHLKELDYRPQDPIRQMCMCGEYGAILRQMSTAISEARKQYREVRAECLKSIQAGSEHVTIESFGPLPEEYKKKV